jgi:hypothetical protein
MSGILPYDPEETGGSNRIQVGHDCEMQSELSG